MRKNNKKKLEQQKNNVLLFGNTGANTVRRSTTVKVLKMAFIVALIEQQRIHSNRIIKRTLRDRINPFEIPEAL